MSKGKKRLLLSWILVFIIVLDVFSFNTTHAEEPATNKKSVLTNITATVTQNGTEIGENGTLISTAPISVNLSFGVPVLGDNPQPNVYISKGDIATFELSSAFRLLSDDNIILKMDEIVVGHVSFATDPVSNMVTATVVFDGDNRVFNGTYNTVLCTFNAEFEFDATGGNGGVGDHLITILEKQYTVTVPPAEIVYTVAKTGVANMDSKSIEWTVDITATQDSANIDLFGYRFFDNLTNVGTYIPDTFKVDSTPATPIVEGSSLIYSFPEDSISPKKITFSTQIPDALYYKNSEQKITNTAQLQNNQNTMVKEGTFETKFTPKWIEKTGQSSDSTSSGTYNPNNRTITWSIVVNQMGLALNNVVVTDALATNLSRESSTIQIWDGTSWGPTSPISPNAQNEYSLSNLTNKALLTIVANVPNEEFATGIKNFTNTATIRWDGLPVPDISSGNIGVDVGFNAITKTGTAVLVDRSIHWTVTVDTRGQNIPNLKVYDLLVYGSSTSGFDITTVTGIPADIATADLTPRYNQQYTPLTFAGGALTLNVYPIMQGTTRVGDLLEITGLSTSAPNTFTFNSLVVNPDIFAGNKTSSVWNTATLFNGSIRLNAATDDVDYKSNTLAKQALNRTAMANPALGVNTAVATNTEESFDYLDKSVIFRLNVNADALDLTNITNASGQALGTATVTDTLPDGWEYADIAPGVKYLIFEGSKNADGTVNALDTNPDTVAGLSTVFDGRTATFTFATLNQPYVILVKAKPTNATAATYFNANKSTTVRNTLALQTQNWTTGVSAFQEVTIRSRLLEKSLNTPKNGELRWTVDYKPYNLPQLGTKLEDTLPVGIDVRTNASGALLLENGNITANEMTLNADGSYTLGSAVTLVLGSNITYDITTRTLSFILPDNTKSYRFTYLTDVTGEPGEISNKVSLYGATRAEESTSQPYIITQLDGTASLQRNGWVSIVKLNENNTPLAGAVFTLFAADGVTPIRTGITGADGTLKFRVIPDGNYTIKETTAPTGYALENITHTLVVSTTSQSVTSHIDGRTDNDAHILTVQNFPQETTGRLTISKNVVGATPADAGDTFDFTLTLDNAPDTYSYTGSGVPNGQIASGDTVTLAHGQSITVTGLPENATYTVVEADYSGKGYRRTSTGDTGTIVAGEPKTANFINIKTRMADLPDGSLLIKKTVTGDLGDREHSFTFSVTLSASGTYPYSGSKSGTIQSGQAVTLKHGENIVIAGLPLGTTYTVTEAEADQDGYHTFVTGEVGTITVVQQIADFTNSRSSVPYTGDNDQNTLLAIGLLSSILLFLVFLAYTLKTKSSPKKR